MPDDDPGFDLRTFSLPPGWSGPPGRRAGCFRPAVVGLIALLLVAAGDVAWWCAWPAPGNQDTTRHDPIEDDPSLEPIFAAAERETRKQLAGIREEWLTKGQMGYCHLHWAVKKRILREKYGIEWRTPGQMNPGIMFD